MTTQFFLETSENNISNKTVNDNSNLNILTKDDLKKIIDDKWLRLKIVFIPEIQIIWVILEQGGFKMVQAEKDFIEKAKTCDVDIGKWQVTLMNINELF